MIIIGHKNAKRTTGEANAQNEMNKQTEQRISKKKKKTTKTTYQRVTHNNKHIGSLT